MSPTLHHLYRILQYQVEISTRALQYSVIAITIRVMPALQHYFEAERLRRGWSMREAAKHCQISVSKAYAIANGDDNVELDTFKNIATAFRMSPAELHIAIGEGPAGESPKRAPLFALIREVPDDKLETVDLVVRPFAVVPPTSRVAKSRKDTQAKRLEKARQRMDAEIEHTDGEGPNSMLRAWSHAHYATLKNALDSLVGSVASPVPA
jgi:transcriptional regulator with XRE-family HTH domain